MMFFFSSLDNLPYMMHISFSKKMLIIWDTLQTMLILGKVQYTFKGDVLILTDAFFTLKLIDIDPFSTFCKILPQGYFSCSLLGQKQVYDTGDEAVMKIYKNIKIGIPEIGTFSAVASKV